MCWIIGTNKENLVDWPKPKCFYRVFQSQWVGPVHWKHMANAQCKHSLFIAYDHSFHM